MNNFEIKFGNINYVCSGSHYAEDNQNWHIQTEIDGLRVSITIPIERKLTTIQALAFVERFHKALIVAKQEQKL